MKETFINLKKLKPFVNEFPNKPVARNQANWYEICIIDGQFVHLYNTLLHDKSHFKQPISFLTRALNRLFNIKYSLGGKAVYDNKETLDRITGKPTKETDPNYAYKVISSRDYYGALLYRTAVHNALFKLARKPNRSSIPYMELWKQYEIITVLVLSNLWNKFRNSHHGRGPNQPIPLPNLPKGTIYEASMYVDMKPKEVHTMKCSS